MYHYYYWTHSVSQLALWIKFILVYFKYYYHYSIIIIVIIIIVAVVGDIIIIISDNDEWPWNISLFRRHFPKGPGNKVVSK